MSDYRKYAAGVLISAGLFVTGVWVRDRPSPYIAGEDIAKVLAASIERRAAIKSWHEAFPEPTNMLWTSDDGGTWYEWQGSPHVGPTRAVSNLMFTAGAIRETLGYMDNRWWHASGYSAIPESGDVLFANTYTGAPYRITHYSGFFVDLIPVTPVGADIPEPLITIDTRMVTSKRYGDTFWVNGPTNIPAAPLCGLSVPMSRATVDRISARFSGGPLDSWWRDTIYHDPFLFGDLEQVISTNKAYVHWGQLPDDQSDTHPRMQIRKKAFEDFDVVLRNMHTILWANPPMTISNASWSVLSSTNAGGLHDALVDVLVEQLSGAPHATSVKQGTLSGDLAFYDTRQVSQICDLPAGEYSFARIWGEWHKKDATFVGVPTQAYASGIVARVRIYICAETSLPNWAPDFTPEGAYAQWWGTNAVSVTPAAMDANALRDMGYGLDFAPMPSDVFPLSNDQEDRWTSGGYITTGRVWTLVCDLENPTIPPSFSIAPDPEFALGSDYAATQSFYGREDHDYYDEDTDTDYPIFRSEFFFGQRIRIVHSVAVIDFKFQHLPWWDYGEDAPAEPYTPPWATNAPPATP